MELWLQAQLRGARSDVRPLSRYRSTLALVVAMAGNGWQLAMAGSGNERWLVRGNSMGCVLCHSVMLVIRTERERLFVLSISIIDHLLGLGPLLVPLLASSLLKLLQLTTDCMFSIIENNNKA
jgi:hypothetical protein